MSEILWRDIEPLCRNSKLQSLPKSKPQPLWALLTGSKTLDKPYYEQGGKAGYELPCSMQAEEQIVTFDARMEKEKQQRYVRRVAPGPWTVASVVGTSKPNF